MLYICIMIEIPNFHYIANSIAAFSFLTSAVLMTLVHAPHAPMWKYLRSCKRYLSLVFLVVGLSCSKTLFLQLPPSSDIIITSTLISAGIQSLLFACTGITFVNPVWISRRWVLANIACIAAYATLLILGLMLWRKQFMPIAIVACVCYFALIVSYQFVFYSEYHKCVNTTDTRTDEYSESHYAWIKHFFIAVTILGVTAGIAPFMPTDIYDIWMLLAACFYSYVVISFVNYCSDTAHLVHKVYEAGSHTIENAYTGMQTVATPTATSHQADASEAMGFDKLEANIQKWVEERGFVKNDLVSEEFAQSLGVNITTLRAYFSQRYQMDFRQWRTRLRIEYACEILKENPDYSYDAIAEMVGICDRSNFTRTFKKITGMTPKDYANGHKDTALNPMP